MQMKSESKTGEERGNEEEPLEFYISGLLVFRTSKVLDLSQDLRIEIRLAQLSKLCSLVIFMAFGLIV